MNETTSSRSSPSGVPIAGGKQFLRSKKARLQDGSSPCAVSKSYRCLAWRWTVLYPTGQHHREHRTTTLDPNRRPTAANKLSRWSTAPVTRFTKTSRRPGPRTHQTESEYVSRAVAHSGKFRLIQSGGQQLFVPVAVFGPYHNETPICQLGGSELTVYWKTVLGMSGRFVLGLCTPTVTCRVVVDCPFRSLFRRVRCSWLYTVSRAKFDRSPHFVYTSLEIVGSGVFPVPTFFAQHRLIALFIASSCWSSSLPRWFRKKTCQTIRARDFLGLGFLS